MNNYLIIFIDSFPYAWLDKLGLKFKFQCRYSLTAGIGYSINIHSEIFAGLTADEVGFFNTWKFDPQNSPFRIPKSLRTLLEGLGYNRSLNWLFRGAIKFIYKYDSLNIPYRFIDMFAPCGQTIYSNVFPAPKLLPNGTKGQDIISGKDEDRYLLAKTNILKVGRLSLFLEELDGIAHRHGLMSIEYKNYIIRLSGWIDDLCDKFRSNYPDGDIIILSDHGMSEVKNAIRFDPEKEFSTIGAHKFIYFVDTTMLRIWYIDPLIKTAAESLLNTKDYGRLLTEKDRADFGISNKKWADSIFLLNEGYVFDPSFLEKGHALAMHGYHPQLPSQKGIFLYSGLKSFNPVNPISTLQCHDMLKEILNGGKN